MNACKITISPESLALKTKNPMKKAKYRKRMAEDYSTDALISTGVR